MRHTEKQLRCHRTWVLAAAVLAALILPVSQAQAKGRLAVLYDVNREVLDADVDTVVARLVDAGLLEPR